MRSFVYRDFSIDGGSIGSITLYNAEDNYYDIIIDKLHNGIQAFMIVKHTGNTYDNIKTILDKISYDLLYRFNSNEFHRDFILHDHSIIKSPGIWNYDKTNKSLSNIWMPFCAENIKYLSLEHIDKDDFCECSFVRGEIDKNGIFSYDYPVVDSCCPRELYEKSRGIMDYFEEDEI